MHKCEPVSVYTNYCVFMRLWPVCVWVCMYTHENVILCFCMYVRVILSIYMCTSAARVRVLVCTQASACAWVSVFKHVWVWVCNPVGGGVYVLWLYLCMWFCMCACYTACMYVILHVYMWFRVWFCMWASDSVCVQVILRVCMWLILCVCACVRCSM